MLHQSVFVWRQDNYKAVECNIQERTFMKGLTVLFLQMKLMILCKIMDIAVSPNQYMNFKRKITPRNILVNRVDAMGDVVLALPVCGLLKKYFPGSTISFLGKSYTKSVAMCCTHVDHFMNRDDWEGLSKHEINEIINAANIDTVIHLLPDVPSIIACANAGIKWRIGARNKILYWRYCNRLVHVRRSKSRLSEAQLNIKLLQALNIPEFPSREEVYKYYGFTRIPPLDINTRQQFDANKFNLIIHPLSSKINAREWGLANVSALIKQIDLTRFKIFITGSVEEKTLLATWLLEQGDAITDVTGKFNIAQLISFISNADGLIASSTGPLHVAAATGIHTLGLYEDRWTKRGERWGPIGEKADYLQCVNDDMNTITPAMVYKRINAWTFERNK